MVVYRRVIWGVLKRDSQFAIAFNTSMVVYALVESGCGLVYPLLGSLERKIDLLSNLLKKLIRTSQKDRVPRRTTTFLREFSRPTFGRCAVLS